MEKKRFELLPSCCKHEWLTIILFPLYALGYTIIATGSLFYRIVGRAISMDSGNIIYIVNTSPTGFELVSP